MEREQPPVVQKYGLWLTLCLVTILYFAHEALSNGPEIESDSDFASVVAVQLVKDILSEDVPHPAGSPANHRVKDRILEHLRSIGIKPHVQATWSCHPYLGRCSPIQNIVAIVGADRASYIALMAHYDSVPTSVGAADDGSGVATVLEIGRLLRDRTGSENGLLLLITDAEEDGLLGAEAFFAQHPLASKVSAVINLEASGTTGRSYLFRTTLANGLLMPSFARSVSYANGSSLYNEVFKHTRSDTDLSVPARYGIAGLDFAYVGERTHQHTINDSLANLDARSIQHQGENILNLTSALLDADLRNPTDVQYLFNSTYGLWVQWPSELSRLLFLVCLVMLSLATWRMRAPMKTLLRGSLIPLLVFGLVVLLFALSFIPIHFINGTTPFWPANDWAYRLVLFSSAALACLFIALRSHRHNDSASLILGVWWFWGFLGLGCTILFPDATHLFLLPLLPAAVALVSSAFLPARFTFATQLLTLIFVVPVHLNLILELEEAQGYWFIVTTAIPFAFLGSTLVPFFQGESTKIAMILAAIALMLGVIGATTTPIWTDHRPQTMVYQQFQNVDSNEAWLRYVSLNAAPRRITEQMRFELQEQIYPWMPYEVNSLARIQPVSVPLPKFELLAQSIIGDTIWSRVRIQSTRGAKWIGMIFPPDSQLLRYRLGGLTYEVEVTNIGDWAGNHVIEVRGTYGQPVEMELVFGRGPREVRGYVFDTADGISKQFVSLIDVRGPTAVQVHGGDRFTIFQKIKFSIDP